MKLRIQPVQALDKDMLGVLKEYEILKAGEFIDACSDTCFIEMEMSNSLSYRLLFVLEEGTTLHLNKITFTIKE